MAGLKKSLAAQLYRAVCPSSHELGEYHLGLVERSRAAQIRTHLRDCPLCAGEIEQLRSYLSSLEAGLQPGLNERIQRWVARLLPPAAPGAPAFALRGEGGAALSYQAGEAQLHLEIQADPAQPDRRTLLGLLLGIPLEGVRVELQQAGQPPVESELDELGNFVLAGLPPGEYSLTLRAPAVEIIVESLTL